MKSIIEEGKTVAQAIHAAWIRAGQPASFSVKIYQAETKNFFGFTTAPAKIALLFSETQTISREMRDHCEPRETRKETREPHKKQTPAPSNDKIKNPSVEYKEKAISAHNQKDRKEQLAQNTKEPMPRPTKEQTPVSPEKAAALKSVANIVERWLKTIMAELNLPNTECSTSTSGHKTIRIFFNAPIIGAGKEFPLLRSLSHLATEHARIEGQKQPHSVNPYVIITSKK